jgi:hypothetical protein
MAPSYAPRGGVRDDGSTHLRRERSSTDARDGEAAEIRGGCAMMRGSKCGVRPTLKEQRDMCQHTEAPATSCWTGAGV